MDIPQEEVGMLIEHNWPSHGEIQFQNVTLRYMPSLPAALHDVSFTISGGTQVSASSSIYYTWFFISPVSGIVEGPYSYI